MLDDKKALEACHNGGEIADEIITFIIARENESEGTEKPRRHRKRL